MWKQMKAGTAQEAALHAAQLQASPSHRVQGALQRVQGCTPEMGMLYTLDQWFVFLYIRTDSFLYLLLVTILMWSEHLMGRFSLLLPFISHTDTCVHCWATSPISFRFFLFHLLLTSDYDTLGLQIEGESPDGAPQILSSE
jgi:hypothetical protein